VRAGEPVAILAGGGRLPFLVGAAAAKAGREPIVIAIAGEAEPAGFAPFPVHPLHWGEIGRLFRLLEESGCREAVLIGGILKRPDFRAIRPDLGAVKLIPRILRLMRGGDNGLLRGVARIFEDHGVRILSPLDVAPDLALPEGLLIGGADAADARHDIDQALDAARAIGRLDVGQGAVAVRGRVVATEDADGTDALLQRVAILRESGRIAKTGGVLVKCLKPQQDRRLDLPTIGPETAAGARLAGLDGVAAEAGRALLAGRGETVDAFRRAGLFLAGLKPTDSIARG